jgi:hypothetical protein
VTLKQLSGENSMKNWLGHLAIVCALLAGSARAATPQFEEFSYQGRLQLNGQPATGTFPMTFALYDASSGGNQVGTTVQKPAVDVIGGSFGVVLNFPGAFTGDQLWLEVTVNGQALASRQTVTAAPVAQFSLSALNGAKVLDYNEVNPSSLASPPSTFLGSAGPFDFRASCGIDAGNAVTVNFIVDSNTAYEVRNLKTSQTNDAGAITINPGSDVNVTGAVVVAHPTASSGNYTRLWETLILRSHSNPIVIASVNVYMSNDARAASTGCVVEGTVTLGL